MLILLLSFFLLIPAIITGVLSFFLWKKKTEISDPYGMLFLTGITLGASINSACYSIEILLSDLQSIMFLIFLRYVGSIIFALSILFFALWFTGLWNKIPGYAIAIIAFPSILSLLVIATNQYHHLFYTEINYISTYGVSHAIHSGSFLYFLFQLYFVILFFLIIILLIRWMVTSPRSYREATWLVFIGCLIPITAQLVYISGIQPTESLNLTPFCFTFTAIAIYLVLTRFHAYTLKPIAYRKVLSEIPIGITVLDNNLRIVGVAQIPT